jgi:hypothetical protein
MPEPRLHPPYPVIEEDEGPYGRAPTELSSRGLEPDFGGVGTTPNYRGGSWVEQRGTTRAAGPYVGRGPKGYARSDERIYEDVCERLLRFGHVDATDIEVQVSRGEVTLTGWVDDRDQKRLAEDLAASVGGVFDVHNRIRIRRQTAVGTAELVREGREHDEG